MHNILLTFGGHIKLSDYMWPSLCPSATFANPYERCSNLGDLRRSVCEGQVPSLQGGKWSPFLMDFVQRCVAKNVEERWSVAELLQVDSSLCE